MIGGEACSENLGRIMKIIKVSRLWLRYFLTMETVIHTALDLVDATKEVLRLQAEAHNISKIKWNPNIRKY